MHTMTRQHYDIHDISITRSTENTIIDHKHNEQTTP